MPFAANRNGARAPGPGTYRALFRSASSHRLPAIILDRSFSGVVVKMHYSPWTGSVEAKAPGSRRFRPRFTQSLAGGSPAPRTIFCRFDRLAQAGVEKIGGEIQSYCHQPLPSRFSEERESLR
jgi:hypothetical protein